MNEYKFLAVALTAQVGVVGALTWLQLLIFRALVFQLIRQILNLVSNGSILIF